MEHNTNNTPKGRNEVTRPESEKDLRKPLAVQQEIRLLDEFDAAHVVTFRIEKFIAAGSNVLCYEASLENAHRGTLREFYPADAFYLDRRPDGQLVFPDSTAPDMNDHWKKEQDYVRSYTKLREMRFRSKDTDMSTFLPDIAIYHGDDKDMDGIGSTYIWTSDPELETFGHICEHIHQAPTENPEQMLVLVLRSIETLTKCILALHTNGLLHRDIKPSNFGFLKRGGEILYQTISLFDVDSIKLIHLCSDEIVRTEGYAEPLPRSGVLADTRTDIYSIGATLFHALIVTKEQEKRGYLYDPESYDRIREMVAASDLIRAADLENRERFCYMITRILRSCLHRSRDCRYLNCEELLRDLGEALCCVLPEELARKKRSGIPWTIAEADRLFDAEVDHRYTKDVQYHLYHHPLYEAMSPEDEELRVYIIGLDAYSRKFLDLTLQYAQDLRQQLNVTVFTDRDEDRQKYLADRPALADFFEVDGAAVKDSYGSVSFSVMELERDNRVLNAKLIHRILAPLPADSLPQYVFIALGDDEINRNGAFACQKQLGKTTRSIISFPYSGKDLADLEAQGLCPLRMNNKAGASDEALERMAFNAHLTWEKNLNVDYSEIRKEFERPYNHDSSLNNAIAIRYKLYNMGIDSDHLEPEDAAEKYESAAADPRQRNELIWREHRRWCVSLICDGWQRQKDLESCVGGITKNEASRRHVCLVKSRPDNMLADFTGEHGEAGWDTMGEDQLQKLDDLDRMSVRLHRMFKKHAEDVKRTNPLGGSQIQAIRKMVSDNPDASVAFHEWYVCMQDLWHAQKPKIRLYEGLKKDFLDTVKAFRRQSEIASIQEQIAAFETLFYPILGSAEYCDYKAKDAALIDNIPFILTYTDEICLVVPVDLKSKGEDEKQHISNDVIFSAVSAALVINPKKIRFLCDCGECGDFPEALEEFAVGVIRLMQKKKLQTDVWLDVGYDHSHSKNYNYNEVVKLERKFRSEGRKLQKQYDRMKISVGNSGNRAAFAAECMKALINESQGQNRKQFIRDGMRVFIEENDTELYGELKRCDNYCEFPAYSFDQKHMTFSSAPFRYIHKKPYLLVSDLRAVRGYVNRKSFYPEFYDSYKVLWDYYCGHVDGWKRLCADLKTYAEKADQLARFRISGKHSCNDILQYYLPSFCHAAIHKLLRELLDAGAIGADSEINYRTTQSCIVTIRDLVGQKDVYDAVFSEPNALMSDEALSFFQKTDDDKTRHLYVQTDRLTVKNVTLNKQQRKEKMNILRWLGRKHYISGLQVSDNPCLVSFTFATSGVKQLLTSEGKLLEIYVYHQLKNSDFDDVVSSYEIIWDEAHSEFKRGNRNEFDCIATKGFSSWFIECKAREQIDISNQADWDSNGFDYYTKLQKITARLGINAQPVMVTDTREEDHSGYAVVNQTGRTYGNKIGVKTIYRPEDIRNIGKVLLDGSPEQPMSR